MSFFSRLFRKPPAVDPYKAALDDYWTRYERWRDAQTCIGCGDPYKGSQKHWVTEYECEPCWRAGIRGAPEDDGKQFRERPVLKV